MKVYVVTASIHELSNLAEFKNQLTETEHEIRVIVVDEGDTKLRIKNNKILQNVSCEFYGPAEREEWFRSRFNVNHEKFLGVMPKKCHAETSFGFLVAYEERADVVVELDDDVFPAHSRNIEHTLEESHGRIGRLSHLEG